MVASQMNRPIVGLVACWALAGTLPFAGAQPGPGKTYSDLPVKVLNPVALGVKEIPAVRTPLGVPNDYKPWIVRLTNGELLIVAFCFSGSQGGGTYVERAVFWRSQDAGLTWGPREERMDVKGREFSTTVLSDGTLLMPCHHLQSDKFNTYPYTISKLFRSTDHGKTWSEIHVGPKYFPKPGGAGICRVAIEMPDPDDPAKKLVLLGVSRGHVKDQVYLWRSRDSGKTWDRSLMPDTRGWDGYDGFFSQASSYRSPDTGKLLHVVRVDTRGKYWKIPGLNLKKSAGDQGDRMMIWESTDNGKRWRRQGEHGNFGLYGEMYPRFLRLRDGRVLLNFTVRSNPTDAHPLGMRAILSGDDGETWDFTTDRMVISYVNHGSSGGSYGNTIQLDDGTLVSTYSYRGKGGKTHVEAIRWKLPQRKDAPKPTK